MFGRFDSELQSVYIYLVTNYFNPAILTTVVWSVVAEVMVNGVMALLVQFFFVFRAWKLPELYRALVNRLVLFPICHEKISNILNKYIKASLIINIILSFGLCIIFSLL